MTRWSRGWRGSPTSGGGRRARAGQTVGPIQNRAQFDKVRAILDQARRDGRVVAGGTAEDRPGYFIRPTIVADIDDDAELVAQEQFGPVLPVLRFSDPEDALARANGTPWGLGGSVWGGDRALARDIALRMDAGQVWINKHLDFGPNIPFGGSKQSGIGVEFAEEGLAEFTQLHVVNEAR